MDRPQDAQLVYLTHEPYDKVLYSHRPWQFISQFPWQYSFFEGDYVDYLDTSSTGSSSDGDSNNWGDDGTVVCRPILHEGKPILVTTYWLVLSLDPLTVLYHDGYIHYSYSRYDENEFLALPKHETTEERVWKGSWTALEHYVNITYANLLSLRSKDGVHKSKGASAAVSIRLDPMTHVRNQMKESVIRIAEGFHKHVLSEMAASAEETRYSSFALFQTQFQVDRNLNVFSKDCFHSYIKGEDHSEVVRLHNDVYGSAFRMLERMNSTSASPTTTTELDRHNNDTYGDDEKEKMPIGRYEWLIRARGFAPGGKLWKFRYGWKYKAKECFN